MFETFLLIVSCSIRAAHKMKIELQKHTLETLSRAVRVTHIPAQKVLESHQIRDLILFLCFLVFQCFGFAFSRFF